MHRRLLSSFTRLQLSATHMVEGRVRSELADCLVLLPQFKIILDTYTQVFVGLLVLLLSVLITNIYKSDMLFI